ncbi:MAG: hypothetical protein KDK29_04550 [Sedimentitalea sp.]|nr:hypothetical protein [Sedimentitalea sp.]
MAGAILGVEGGGSNKTCIALADSAVEVPGPGDLILVRTDQRLQPRRGDIGIGEIRAGSRGDHCARVPDLITAPSSKAKANLA